MSYTIYIKSGVVKRNSDGTQVLPGRDIYDPVFIEYLQWTQAGNSPTPDYTNPTEVIILDAKQQRLEQLKALKTSVDGMEFDADEASQERIARTVVGLSPAATIKWVLADNTVHIVTREQLQQVLVQAVAQTTDIWTAPYDLQGSSNMIGSSAPGEVPGSSLP